MPPAWLAWPCWLSWLAPVCGIGHIAGYAIDPAWGYRTLMLGWAVYSLVVVLAAWWAASLRVQLRSGVSTFGPPQALLRMAAVWVRAAAILAVFLGLKAAFFHAGEQLWAAAAIALASGADAPRWPSGGGERVGPLPRPGESIWPHRSSSGISSSARTFVRAVLAAAGAGEHHRHRGGRASLAGRTAAAVRADWNLPLTGRLAICPTAI